MILPLTSLKYSDVDYNTVKQHLMEIIPLLTDKWTDFNESDVGMVLLELMCRLSDYSAYRRDRNVQELLITTAKERKNVKALLKTIGYKMDTWISCTCEAIIYEQLYYDKDIVIPAYTQFSITPDIAASPLIYFSNLNEVNIFADSESATFTLTQGEVKSYEYDYDDIISGKLYLPHHNIGQNTISLRTRGTKSNDSEIIDWIEVEDVFQTIDSGYYFSHEVDKEGRNYIQFHSIYTAVLTDSSVIEVKYLLSLGSSGTLGSNKVVNIVDTIYDSDGNSVNSLLVIKNTTSSTGGSDPETITNAKKYGPLSVRTMYTCVTLNDYVIRAESHGSVAKAQALDWNFPEETGLTEGYQTYIYVVPELDSDGNELVVDDEFKVVLYNYLDPRRLSATKITIFEANYLEVQIDVTAYVSQGFLHKDRVRANILNATRAMFDRNKINFGDTIFNSVLITALQNSDSAILGMDLGGTITKDGVSIPIAGNNIVSPKNYFIKLMGEPAITITEV